MAKARTIRVRVLPEVEALVQALHEKCRYDLSTVRNIALLLGLERLAELIRETGEEPIKDDSEFWQLYERVKAAIESLPMERSKVVEYA